MVTPAFLIVDDDPMLRLLMWRMLARRFPEVLMISAGSVAAAQQTILTRQPLLVVTDYHLADGTGGDVLRAALRVDPTLPVVVVSADATVADRVLRAGARAFVAKPFATRTLQDTVVASLGGPAARHYGGSL